MRSVKKRKIKDYPETHQQGYLTIKRDLPKVLKDCDFGIQIAKDGQVWVCVDGLAFLRFRPKLEILSKIKKNLYKGTFNWYGEPHVLHSQAKDEDKAFSNFITQLSKLLKRSRRSVYLYFINEDIDNWKVVKVHSTIKQTN